MSGVEFDNLAASNLFWVALLVCAAGVYGIWQRQRALRTFADMRLLASLAPRVGWLRSGLRLGLVTICLGLLTAAIMGPRWGEREQQVVRRGLDVMVLLDVSRSMLARDIAPNRLERAKISIADDLLPRLGGDRIGLITFAGVPTLKCPLTSDYGFFRLALQEVNTESAPRGGTLIGDAIRKAGDCFPTALDTHKVVILITDGEDQDSFPIEAAEGLWKDKKIPVVTVVLGDEREGARIPVKTSGGETYLEYKGQTVWSRANFDQLRAVAAASDLNAFIPVGTKNFDLGEIFADRILPAIKYRDRTETEATPLPSQFHPFAVGALALLIVESLIRPAPRTPAASTSAVRLGRTERDAA